MSGSVSPPPDARRVLVLLPQPFLEDRGTSIAIHHYLRALSELGQPTDVLCFQPGRDIELPHVRTIRAPNPFGFEHVPIGLSGKKLLLDAFLLRTFRRQLAREEYLFVHAVEEAVFLTVALGGARSPPVVYDMQSSIPEQLVQYRGLANRPVQRTSARVEDWLLRRVDFVVCSEGLEDRVRQRAPGTPVLQWRFPAAAGTVPAGEVEELRDSLGIPTRDRVVLYVGSFARYQGVPLLVEALPRVLRGAGDVWFVAVGSTGPDETRRMRDAVDPDVRDRVLILPRVDRDRVPVFMALADLLLLPRIHGSNLSLKTFDYLAAGKPIVATDFHTHHWLEREGLACLAPLEPNGFGDAVARVLADPEQARALGAAAAGYADRYLGWDRFTELVANLLERMRQLRPGRPYPARSTSET